MQETRVWSLGPEDPLEEETAMALQYSYLEYPMDRGDWWAAVHGVTKTRTRLGKEHTRTILKYIKKISTSIAYQFF